MSPVDKTHGTAAKVLEQLAKIDPDRINDPKNRAAAISHARSLLSALESPEDTILWLAWAEPTRQAAIRTALRLNIFQHLRPQKSITELSSITSASPGLVRRVMQHLAATNVVAEAGPGVFAATSLSDALCDKRNAAALKYYASMPGPVLGKIENYLDSTKFEEPGNTLDGPFQYAMQTELPPWQWGRNRPDVAKNFVLHMSGYHAGRVSWMEDGFYPVQERLVKGFHEDDVFLVDVGGSQGHDLEEFRTKQSEIAKGKRFVLQDLEGPVKSGTKARPWIEGMVHDFFEEQPVKGARAYYMHSVLHDWPDEECIQILQRLRDAMRIGYSKILIYENVVPDQKASWYMTSLDWTMMAVAASAERTESQWRKLISAAGLRVSGIWNKDPRHASLIEAVIEENSKL